VYLAQRDEASEVRTCLFTTPTCFGVIHFRHHHGAHEFTHKISRANADFITIHSFTGPGVDSASNRNEYQEYFLGVKAAGA
jgi:hypothetical protein